MARENGMDNSINRHIPLVRNREHIYFLSPFLGTYQSFFRPLCVLGTYRLYSKLYSKESSISPSMYNFLFHQDHHIFLNFLICRLALSLSNIHFIHIQFHAHLVLCFMKFGQKAHRLGMAR